MPTDIIKIEELKQKLEDLIVAYEVKLQRAEYIRKQQVKLIKELRAKLNE